MVSKDEDLLCRASYPYVYKSHSQKIYILFWALIALVDFNAVTTLSR